MSTIEFQQRVKDYTDSANDITLEEIFEAHKQKLALHYLSI
ncbi:hypothetical protein [Cohnella thailandensis]|nr:hypothetical protein [Cohnella thailandensis]MBP1973535.1 hypothetical protein [Cohnella thailandensis]